MARNQQQQRTPQRSVIKPPKAGLKGKQMSTAAKQTALALKSLAAQTSSRTYELGCSMARPFECSGCVPDGARNIGCFTIRQTYGQNTGTGTCVSFAWNPDPSALSANDSGSANATPTIAGNWGQAIQLTSIQALYGKYRKISAGIKASYVGNTVNDGGTILIGQVSGEVPLNSFNGASMTTAQSLFQTYDIFPVRNGGDIVWMAESQAEQQNWVDLGLGTTAVSAQLAQPYILCIVYGATASSGILHIEAVANFEGQYKSQTFLPGGIDSAPPMAEPGWFEKAQNVVRALRLAQVLPAVGMAATAAGFPAVGAPLVALGGMANGLTAPGLMSKSGLPRGKR